MLLSISPEDGEEISNHSFPFVRLFLPVTSATPARLMQAGFHTTTCRLTRRSHRYHLSPHLCPSPPSPSATASHFPIPLRVGPGQRIAILSGDPANQQTSSPGHCALDGDLHLHAFRFLAHWRIEDFAWCAGRHMQFACVYWLCESALTGDIARVSADDEQSIPVILYLLSKKNLQLEGRTSWSLRGLR